MGLGRLITNDNYISGQSINAALTATATGVGIDFTEGGPLVTAIITHSMEVEEDALMVVTLEESASLNGTYAAFSPAASVSLDADATPRPSQPTIRTFPGRSLPFVRAVATITGTSPDTTTAIVLLAERKSTS